MKGLKIFVVVLVVLVLCGGAGYLIYDNLIKKNDSEPQVNTIESKEYKAGYSISDKKVADMNISDLDVLKDRYNGVLDITLNGNYITSIPFIFVDFDGNYKEYEGKIEVLAHEFANDYVLIQIQYTADKIWGDSNYKTGDFLVVTASGEVLEDIRWNTMTMFKDKNTGKNLIYEINADSLIIYEPVYGNEANGVLALKQQYTVNNGTVVKTTLKNLTAADVDASGK